MWSRKWRRAHAVTSKVCVATTMVFHTYALSLARRGGVRYTNIGLMWNRRACQWMNNPLRTRPRE